jgi:hypothetical protein
MTGAIWVLGATGRVGREAVERLQRAGAEVVVVGRDRDRLTQVCPGARAVTGSLDEVCARLATEAPTVVINTVGPFAVTAPRVARACPPGTHYVDVANELSAFELLHGMDQEAATTGSAPSPRWPCAWPRVRAALARSPRPGSSAPRWRWPPAHSSWSPTKGLRAPPRRSGSATRPVRGRDRHRRSPANNSSHNASEITSR